LLRERTAVEHSLAYIGARKRAHARYRGVRKISSTCAVPQRFRISKASID
jgi:hypothetical protein